MMPLQQFKMAAKPSNSVTAASDTMYPKSSHGLIGRAEAPLMVESAVITDPSSSASLRGLEADDPLQTQPQQPGTGACLESTTMPSLVLLRFRRSFLIGLGRRGITN